MREKHIAGVGICEIVKGFCVCKKESISNQIKERPTSKVGSGRRTIRSAVGKLWLRLERNICHPVYVFIAGASKPPVLRCVKFITINNLNVTVDIVLNFEKKLLLLMAANVFVAEKVIRAF